MDEQLKKFAQAIQQGLPGITGPSSSYAPELTNYMTADAREGLTKSSVAGMGAIAETQGKLADEAEERSRRNRIEELKDMMDPNKYQKVRKQDGGFDFLDPSGQKIDINTFAQRTGARRVDILKDSENQLDQQYINDWSNANDLAQAAFNGDSDTIAAFTEQNPNLKGKKPEDILRELIERYPHLYGRGTYADTLSRNGGNPAFRNNPNYIGASSGGGGFQL